MSRLTEISLREYFDRRIGDLDTRMSERFVLGDSAIAKAERTMNDRLNAMNEFREALKDQAALMATRNELGKLDEEVQELRRAKSNMDGRLVVLTGGISFAVSLLLWALTRFVH